MTKAPESVNEDTPIEQAISHMRAGPYRRLPVVDRNGKLLGMVSLDDILDFLAKNSRRSDVSCKMKVHASSREFSRNGSVAVAASHRIDSRSGTTL